MRRGVRGRPEAAADRRWAVVGGGWCSVGPGWQKEAAWPIAARPFDFGFRNSVVSFISLGASIGLKK
jgi:hypothetical protein